MVLGFANLPKEGDDFAPAYKTMAPLFFGQKRVGWIANQNIERLRDEASIFSIERAPRHYSKYKVSLKSYPAETETAFSERLNCAVHNIYSQDQSDFGKWNNEYLGVGGDPITTPLFKMQRCAAAFFGVSTIGVHLNVFFYDGAGNTQIWAAKRSKNLDAHPNLFDQPAAGFLSFGTSPDEKLREEAYQEAGIPATTLRNPKMVAIIPFAVKIKNSVQIGKIISYDLVVNPTFKPYPLDAEVAQFHLFTPTALINQLSRKDLFKFDSRLVAIDFLGRHSLIDSSHDLIREQLAELSRFGVPSSLGETSLR